METTIELFRKNNKTEFDNLNNLFINLREVKKKRSCLMCGKMFDSVSAGNRRCSKCARVAGIRIKSGFGVNRMFKVLCPVTSSTPDDSPYRNM